MNFSQFYHFFVLIFIIFPFVDSSGSVELVVMSPQTVLMTWTICTTSHCSSLDQSARKAKINANVSFRTEDSPYQGEAPKYYDLHIVIFNTDGEQIGSIFNSPHSDTTWQNGMIPTSAGFNVTIKYRTMCDTHWYGMRCNRFCQEMSELHTECSRSGEKRCMQGWSGSDCMTPICDKSCSGRGRCVSPGQCQCQPGYTGSNCDVCQPKRGCLHGGCSNMTAFTCECLPGYSGTLCTKDFEICNRRKPCQNNGICSNEMKEGSKGYKCECREGFVGDNCEIPIDNVKCGHEYGDNVCMNGGTCISLSEKSIECKCRSGYSGKFCQFGNENDVCAGVVCRNGGNCTIDGKKPKCECATCYTGDRCEILDANCLVSRVNETILATNFRRNEFKTEEDTGYENIMIITLMLVIVLLLSFAVFLFCTRYRNTIEEAGSEVVSSPKCRKLSSSPNYKICVIDAELSSSQESEVEMCSSQNVSHSPPPAYYPPIPRYPIDIPSKKINEKKYQTIPTTESTNYPIVSLESTIV